MTRTAEAIRAEMDHLKASGIHHMSKQVRDLRAELADAEGETVEVETPAESPAPIDVAISSTFADMSDPMDTDEWRFVEKACAEVQIGQRGSQTDIIKKCYNELWAKLTVWRAARDLVLRIGVGNPWPQFAALGVCGRTGQPLPAKPPEPEAAPSAPTQTAGGMPVRSHAPSASDILATVTGGDPSAALREEIASRPEPASVGP